MRRKHKIFKNLDNYDKMLVRGVFFWIQESGAHIVCQGWALIVGQCSTWLAPCYLMWIRNPAQLLRIVCQNPIVYWLSLVVRRWLPLHQPSLCLFILVPLCINTIARPFVARVPSLVSFTDKAPAPQYGALWTLRAMYCHLFLTTTLLIFQLCYHIIICVFVL